ncbi:MAG TPA: hypothetical protein VE172_19210 [Stackebrandtia sp.]|jgi:hypothetical protein|uniref:hypothetical protein n=1 Tax=Stackebrandtia sp. TaxID=2023065 RepID=UPI002D65775F|nr:hypothetical protein [Stackebrandtia sp.]HZE40933.1 hypothetical protein [Stackebrandtia sp.]
MHPDPDRTLRLPSVLDDVYSAVPDEPADRLGIHVLLEALLLAALAGGLLGLFQVPGNPLASASGRGQVMALAVPALLATMALALSLRACAPNLAVGVIGLGAAKLFADNASRGLPLALTIAAGAALGAGLVIAAAVVLLRAPGWLASAAVAAGVFVWLSGRPGSETPPVPHISHSWVWLVGCAALSVLGGMWGATNGTRRRLGECRLANATIARRSGGAVATQIAALAASSLVAAAAGLWMSWVPSDTRAAEVVDGPWSLTAFAVAAALLGGTSALGRRGGFLGSVLASFALLTALLITAQRHPFNPLWTIGGALGLGLVITRIVERFGAPKPTWWEDRTDTSEMDRVESQAFPTTQVNSYDPGDIDPYRGVN